MENKARKKHTQGISVNNEGKDTGGNPALATQVHKPPVHKVLNMPLNPDTARQAVILSEIIGKPVSRRGRR